MKDEKKPSDIIIDFNEKKKQKEAGAHKPPPPLEVNVEEGVGSDTKIGG